MNKPSPEILDVFYRAGGFPIDDLDVTDFVKHTTSVFASTWFVPTRTIPAVFFIMGGGSGDLTALIHELRHLAEVTECSARAFNWRSEKRSVMRGLCYHYYVIVTHIDARVYSKGIEPWDEGLTPLLHAPVLHPWFKPYEAYPKVYEIGYIKADNLPTASIDDQEAYEFLGDPDAPVAKRSDIKPFRGAFEDEIEEDEITEDQVDPEAPLISLANLRNAKEEVGPDVSDDL